MNRICVFIFALVYINTSAGVTLNMHYCMGELVDWSFLHNNDENCSRCGMSESETKGCCQDDRQILQVDMDQIANAAFHSPQMKAAHPPDNISLELPYKYVAPKLEVFPISNAPPNSSGIPVYKRNRNLLI